MKQQMVLVWLILTTQLGSVCSCNVKKQQDEVLLDFVYVGCNRVTHHDKNSRLTDASRANLAQLKKIYEEISRLKNPPAYFFFLGDLVLGEKDTATLRSELHQWVKDFTGQGPGEFNYGWNSRIKLIAVPGNHELLTEDQSPPYKEYPLKDALSVWMDEMHAFLPDSVTRAGDGINQATYSFQHGNTFFVVMNTDTYNNEKQTGLIPVEWIKDQLRAAAMDRSIEHILLLGHKPAYYPENGSQPVEEKEEITILRSQSDQLWPEMQKAKAAAMLSAHVHAYDRFQPDGNGSYQVIAGNAGSLQGENKVNCGKAPDFFGYSHIYVMKSGKLIHVSRGWKVDACDYLKPLPQDIKICTYDSLEIQWGTKNNDWSLTGGKNCQP